MHSIVNKLIKVISGQNETKKSQCNMLTEDKPDEIGARLQNSPQKFLTALHEMPGFQKHQHELP